MTAITDTRKRSRDEDSCDFMPISKRINNLTLTSQCFGENENSTKFPADYLMAISNQNLQSNDFAQQNNYSNQVAHNHHHQHHQQHHHHHQVATTHHDYDLTHAVPTTTTSTTIQRDIDVSLPSNNTSTMFYAYENVQFGNSISIDNELNNNGMDSYCPELTPEENPFYYNKNKLLFDLHIERERRHHNP